MSWLLLFLVVMHNLSLQTATKAVLELYIGYDDILDH